MQQLKVKLNHSLRSVFAAIDTRNVWQWAEDEIVLTRRQTESPGPYSTLLTPYVKELLQCFNDTRVTDLTLCFGSQTSKTTIMMIGAAWRIVNNPAPSIWVMPTENLARSFSENRWQPMVEDCRLLAKCKPSNTHRWKTLEQQFRDATLVFIGSNSPANLASRPCGLLLMDETDKFARPTNREAGAVALAENRTKSFTNAFRVKSSTPTTEDAEIWQAFQAGDRRYYFVPCPHCGHMQQLLWSQVKWNAKSRRDNGSWDMNQVQSTAFYECTNCKGHINNGHKTKMLREGEWRATNADAAMNCRSYHLNSLYAPWKSCGFGEMAVKFLTDKASLIGLQDFVNGALAEPWQDANDKEEAPQIAASDYCMGEIWPEAEFSVMTVDVQDSGGRHFWALIDDWAKDGRSRRRWAGRVETWDELERIRLDSEIRQSCVFVDSAFATREVYFACCRFGWVAFRGSDNEAFTWIDKGRRVQKLYSKVERGDPAGGGKIDTQTLLMKTCAVIKFSKPTSMDILATLRRMDPPIWEFAKDMPIEWHEHLASTVKKRIRNPITGVIQQKWVVIKGRPNHLYDCAAMSVVAAVMARVLSPQGKKPSLAEAT